MKFVELEKEKIKTIPFEEARYFMMAEPNAMGKPGEAEIVLNDMTSYTFNYVYNDISFLDFAKDFPEIKEFEYGVVVGAEYMEMNGWSYFHLSSGNHLMVHKSLRDRFVSYFNKTDPPVYIYQNWRMWAEDIASHQVI